MSCSGFFVFNLSFSSKSQVFYFSDKKYCNTLLGNMGQISENILPPKMVL